MKDEPLQTNAVRVVLLLRCEAGPGIGAGHLYRCVALAEAARERDLEAVFVLNEGAGPLFEVIADRDFRVQPVGDESFLPKDAEKLLGLGESVGADALLLDGYGFTEPFLARLYENIVTVIIDDLADRRFPVDLLVNPSPGAETLDYRVPASTKLLLGAPYSLVRPEIQNLRKSGGWGSRNGTLRRVLVTLGGSPPIATLLTVLAGLEAAEFDGEVDVVLGPLVHGDLGMDSHTFELRVYRGVSDLPALLSVQDLAICAGGVTSLELACLGIPMLQIVLAQNQRQNIAGMAAAGASVPLGEIAELTPERVTEAIEELDGAAEKLAAMHRAGLDLIDGLGPFRVLDALGALRRKARVP